MYTLYAWEFDGDGGYTVCKTEEFHKPYGYKVAKLGEFNTVEELTQFIEQNEECRFWSLSAVELLDDIEEA